MLHHQPVNNYIHEGPSKAQKCAKGRNRLCTFEWNEHNGEAGYALQYAHQDDVALLARSTNRKRVRDDSIEELRGPGQQNDCLKLLLVIWLKFVLVLKHIEHCKRHHCLRPCVEVLEYQRYQKLRVVCPEEAGEKASLPATEPSLCFTRIDNFFAEASYAFRVDVVPVWVRLQPNLIIVVFVLNRHFNLLISLFHQVYQINFNYYKLVSEK